MRPVTVRPWVEVDVLRAVLHDRALLGHILFDLSQHLPNNLGRYQSRRIVNSPRCFWYDRTYSLDPNSFQLRHLRFVVRDFDPTVLDVIWVVIVV